MMAIEQLGGLLDNPLVGSMLYLKSTCKNGIGGVARVPITVDVFQPYPSITQSNIESVQYRAVLIILVC
jgi:hypothetical protein